MLPIDKKTFRSAVALLLLTAGARAQTPPAPAAAPEAAPPAPAPAAAAPAAEVAPPAAEPAAPAERNLRSEIQSGGAWYPGKILKKDEKNNRYYVLYHNQGIDWEEWVTADRIRPMPK